MKITSYLHTAILVSDLEKAEHFYSDILGLSQVERSLNFEGIWYQIGDYQIHLIVDSNFENNRHNFEKIGRNPHLALAVDDLELAKKSLESAGFAVSLSASGRKALFTQDPDGNIIEIQQLMINS
jgi:catechol 2,3-dioxygenase-like lactoylglutathione lyase family enzyme